MQQASVNPYTTVRSGNTAVPLFMLTFDERGTCTSPQTLAAVLEKARDGSYRHVHVYSHGWNNVFKVAEERVEQFFGGYLANRERGSVRGTPADATVFVGIIWPSTALVAPSEATPKIAAVHFESDAEAVASELAEGDRERFLALVKASQHDAGVAHDLAAMVLPIVRRARDESDAPEAPLEPEDLIRMAQAASSAAGSAERGDDRADAPRFATEDEPVTTTPAAAGKLPGFDPRWIVRIATVLLMKDRAGTVGAGVGRALIEPLLRDSHASVHGVGHSYGTKVMLASICARPLPRKMASLLLLEPAISRFCFAADVDGAGTPGGFREALERVEAPIFSTWSRNDRELRNYYQLAARRRTDPGELRALGLFDRYEALGGYGPTGLKPGEQYAMELAEPGIRYPRDDSARIYALDGSNGRITSHGDVTNDYTEWAHVTLVDEVWAP